MKYLSSKTESKVPSLHSFRNDISISRLKSSFTKGSLFSYPKHSKSPSSLFTVQNEILNSLNINTIQSKKKRKPLLPFEDYIDQINNSMVHYTTLSARPREDTEGEVSKNQSINERLITAEEQSIIKKVHELNQSFISKGLSSLNEESILKVSIPAVDYRNPYQSLSILRQNHIIYDEISKNFLHRQKDLFDDSIKAFEGYTMKYKVKMPKIRVLNVAPKVSFEIPVIDCVDEKKKKDLPALPPIPQNGLKLFAYYRYPNKNFPGGREQFSLAMNGGEIILVGGMSSSMKSMSVWSLNIENLEWKNIKGDNLTNCRFGHTGVIYQNKIYVFGGRTKYTNSTVYSNFDLFSFSDNHWVNPSIGGKNLPQLRRNHIAEVIGNQMLIHGGMGDNGEILSDCFLLNFSPLKWTSCSVNPYSEAPAVYGHSSALVLPRDIITNHRFNIYKYPDLGITKGLNSKLKERGLYVFGGKSKEEGGITNDLWILLLGKKPLEWVKPETKGTPPTPRYFHSMNYYEKGNFLIIHGGRNDEANDSFALNDTYIFDLENFDWLKVELYSHIHDFKILCRCGHQSMIYSNKLIIIGGMNNNNYVGSALLIVNLDFYYFPKMKSTEEIMIDKLKNNNDPESKYKIQKLKNQIQKNQLGLVTQISLPPIK